MKNQAGLSLIELTVAMAITGFLILAMTTVMGFSFQTMNSLKVVSVRDQIHRELREELMSLEAIRQTRLHEPIFNACFGRGPAATALCEAQQDLSIRFWDKAGTQVVAGPIATPVYYNADGFRCAGPSPLCPISVSLILRAQGLPRWTDNWLQDFPVGLQQHDLVELKYRINVAGLPGLPEARQIQGSVVLDTMDFGDTP